MYPMTPAQRRFLFELLSTPTAPFREQLVAACACARLDAAHVPYFEDEAGNIVVGVDSLAAYRKLLASKGPCLPVFAAHMDHPGFHGLGWNDAGRLEVAWHGGTPVKQLAGARLWLADETGRVGEGVLMRPELSASGRTLSTSEVRLPAASPVRRLNPRQLFGGFGFSRPVWARGNRLYTHAADDLVGVFAIIETARAQMRRRHQSPPFIGLLTRAEEVGFVGAIAHFETGLLSAATRPVIFVSLEASRNLVGAVLGKGPIVRLGDRRTVYDPNALRALETVATRALGRAYQRRIMDGGACEAAAATIFGLRAMGITVPLGNYHNQNLDGGPETRGLGSPAPEFVDMRDIAGLLKLCRALLNVRLDWVSPWQAERKQLMKNYRAYTRHLR